MVKLNLRFSTEPYFSSLSQSREYQITTSPGNCRYHYSAFPGLALLTHSLTSQILLVLFYAGNSYLDFEGNVQLAVKTMAPVDISDDSDSVSDSRSQSADVVVTPDLSNVRLDEQVQSGSDDNSDSDSDSDVEIIEIIEADNQSDHQAGDRNESPELVAPERLPARLVGFAFLLFSFLLLSFVRYNRY